MNLTEEKKMPLRMQPTENKKKMLINHYKGVTQVSYCISKIFKDCFLYYFLYFLIVVLLANFYFLFLKL